MFLILYFRNVNFCSLPYLNAIKHTHSLFFAHLVFKCIKENTNKVYFREGNHLNRALHCVSP